VRAAKIGSYRTAEEDAALACKNRILGWFDVEHQNFQPAFFGVRWEVDA
jgi:hypothetical protein